MMQLNFPAKRDRMSREQVMFELGLPSLNEIRASKRRRITTQPDREHELSFVCTLEGKGGADDQRGIPSGKKPVRCQGYLDHPVIGEASLRPSSIADLDSKAKREMKESEIKELLTTADDKRSKIQELEILSPIQAPGLIYLEEERDEPKQKRVSLPDEILLDKVLELFKEQDAWRVEEMAERLNHPREPIKRLLKESIADFDPIRKWYTKKNF